MFQNTRIGGSPGVLIFAISPRLLARVRGSTGMAPRHASMEFHNAKGVLPEVLCEICKARDCGHRATRWGISCYGRASRGSLPVSQNSTRTIHSLVVCLFKHIGETCSQRIINGRKANFPWPPHNWVHNVFLTAFGMRPLQFERSSMIEIYLLSVSKSSIWRYRKILTKCIILFIYLFIYFNGRTLLYNDRSADG